MLASLVRRDLRNIKGRNPFQVGGDFSSKIQNFDEGGSNDVKVLRILYFHTFCTLKLFESFQIQQKIMIESEKTCFYNKNEIDLFAFNLTENLFLSKYLQII